MKRFICSLIVICLLFLGMHIEVIDVDDIFVCTNADDYIYFVDITEEDSVSQDSKIQMIRFQNSTFVAGGVKRSSIKNDMKIYVQLCNIESIENKNYYYEFSLEFVKSPELYSKIYVLEYIHNIDGKSYV